jgi:sugar/nucleoside kinase (ribokinase family)
MNVSECQIELQEFLGRQTETCRVVVMPDLFLDRIVNLPWGNNDFCSKVTEVAKRKGGSIDGVPQRDMKGGNAVNTASALVRLGALVTPILCTSSYGLELLKFHFKNFAINYSHIKIKEKASITTALEFRGDNEKINVMLRDVGALEDFGPLDINESDFEAINNSNYVCLFNWAGTRKHGTALAKVIFERAKQNTKIKTYYDTSDPNPNASDIPCFVDTVLRTSSVDVLSVNENEAVTYANVLDREFKEKRGKTSFAEYSLEAARLLAKNFSARIDLHTSLFSVSLRGKHEVMVPSFRIKVLRATGAGDSWNAGNILGDHIGLSDKCRLTLANAVSACYLSAKDGLHPTKDRIASFLRSQLDVQNSL